MKKARRSEPWGCTGLPVLCDFNQPVPQTMTESVGRLTGHDLLNVLTAHGLLRLEHRRHEDVARRAGFQVQRADARVRRDLRSAERAVTNRDRLSTGAPCGYRLVDGRLIGGLSRWLDANRRGALDCRDLRSDGCLLRERLRLRLRDGCGVRCFLFLRELLHDHYLSGFIGRKCGAYQNDNLDLQTQ